MLFMPSIEECAFRRDHRTMFTLKSKVTSLMDVMDITTVNSDMKGYGGCISDGC